MMAARHIVGLIPALGGLDALVFTGGIGEHSQTIRDKITHLMTWVGQFALYIIPTDEELVIAQACQKMSRDPA
jgi:acetate kinase